ncbi:MAG: PH domain-containing protein [Vicingaceae bacterium]
MEFKNNTISLEQLPQIESVAFQKLNKEYLWMRITFMVSLYLILLSSALIYNYFTEKFDWWLLPALLSFFLLWLLTVEIVGFKIKGYALRERDISYKSGWVFFSMTSVPFNRIQHSEVTQGPFERMFDLAKVKVYTAGGSGSDISIVGLNEVEANQLKEHINTLSSKHA